MIPFSAVLEPSVQPSPDLVKPVLEATARVTATTVRKYATYRKRNVDAGIVQPKAYDVARRATFELLNSFMDQREQTLHEEVQWLKEQKIDCVLSDATFLGW